MELFHFSTLGKPAESLLSFACDWLILDAANHPKSYDRCHNGKVRENPICLSDYEKRVFGVEARIHSGFEPILQDIYKCLPLKVQMVIGCACTAEKVWSLLL